MMDNLKLYEMIACLRESVYVRVLLSGKEVISGYVCDIQDLQGYWYYQVDHVGMLLNNMLLVKIEKA